MNLTSQATVIRKSSKFTVLIGSTSWGTKVVLNLDCDYFAAFQFVAGYFQILKLCLCPNWYRGSYVTTGVTWYQNFNFRLPLLNASDNYQSSHYHRNSITEIDYALEIIFNFYSNLTDLYY